MVSVLLADDHALVRSGFAMVLSVAEDLHVVGQAANGQEAVDLVTTGDVDVVLMDVQMPVMDGIEATRRIVEAGGTKVIILTTFDRDDYLFAALRAGASGFLLKNADPDDLIAAVHAVADGHALLAPEATLKVIRQLTDHNAHPPAPAGQAPGGHAPGGQAPTAEQPRETDPDGSAVPAAATVEPTTSAGLDAEDQRMIDTLTHRESEVLTLMAQGMSNAEIAQKLFLGSATIKTHVSNLLAKTGSRDRVQAVVFAYRTGLVRGV
ncbi:response regulator [Kocuria soli]|uniref:Response regulator n=1 Tax=Kocuria soli TaxID=2485125 RepID=A0A3N3ZMD3_9MICC|nr:response regulator transcription factor [Kocuria soli]ROZ61829.1 response regulator [Kocuria soli]